MLRGLTCCSTNRILFGKSGFFRPILYTRKNMASDGDVLERLEKRAVEAEETISLLKSQLLFLQKAAERKTKTSFGVKDHISALKQENEHLRQEADKLKAELEYWEVRNGLKQVDLPNSKQAESSEVQVKEKKAVAEQAESKSAAIKQEEKPPEKKPKKEKVEKSGKGKNSGKEEQPHGSAEPDVHHIDFRVGKIVSAKRHPDADTLFVEEIDVGEETPRTVCSGLVGSVELEELQDRIVIVMCNLKPVKMRGIMSQAMVMCSANEERTKFEVLDPPAGSLPGDRVVFEGFPGEPDKQLNPKKKIWEQVKPHLRTNDAGVACYKGIPFTVHGKGECTTRTLKNATVC